MRALLPVWVACAALGVATAAWSQEAPEAPAAPVAAPAPIAIRLPEIAGQAEELRRVLGTILRSAAPLRGVDAIDARLDATSALVAQLADESDAVVGTDVPLDILSELEREWWIAGRQLDLWRRELTERATELETHVAQLRLLERQWELTAVAAQAEGAPDSVLAQIRDARQTVQDARRTVKDREEVVLNLQNRVGQQRLTILESSEDLRDERERAESLLFRRSGPPLWEAWPPATGEGPADWVFVSFQRRAKRTELFARARGEFLAVHAASTVLLVALFLWLRARARRWPEDDARRTLTAPVLHRPVAAGLLLGLLCAPFFFYTQPPLLFSSALGLALLVPVLRLLPGLVEPGLRPALWALAGFFVLDGLRLGIAAEPAVERILLALEAVAAAILIAWLIRPARLSELSGRAPLPGGISFAIRLGLALLCVSVAANLVGFVPLARLLVDGVLGAAYTAVLLYGGARVLRVGLYVALRSEQVNRVRMVRNRQDTLVARGARVVNVAGGLVWIWVVLGLFLLRDELADLVGILVGSPIPIGVLELSLGDLLAFALTLTLAILLARLVRYFLEEDVFPRVRAPRGVPYAVSVSAQYALIAVGIVFAFGAGGVDFGRFAIVAGALGVGIGFGLQNVVNNFVSGLILLFERPIQVGDTVQVADLFGEVRRIGIRSSTVRTWQGAEVIIPNGTLVAENVVNWTLSDRHRRIELRVGVAYGTDPERVLALLLEVARAHAAVETVPAPSALFLGFGDSSLDFELRAWTRRADAWMAIRSDLAVAVNAALREAGIAIPFPQRDLHVRSGPPTPPA